MSPEEEFGSCLENAESWIRMIQERLEATDNVQGPKAALENRLRESEVILAEEPEGNLRLGRVLVKAESLLQGRSDDEKHEIQAAMKHIKTLWEDTQINMAHCHSRIEWVLLHWSEYLKAREDYFLWLMNMKQKLEPDLELQLGLKEKKLQLSHHTVLLSNILNQAALLERLIQESGSLFAKTEDETVNEAAQQMLKADHEALQMKAKEKVKILEAIVQEHQQYADRREKFQNWLQCMKEKFNNCYTCTGDKNQMERSLTELKELSDAVSSQKGELDNLQVQATAVILNTSPLGAELITKDLEELRADWNSLRLRCQQDQEPLKLGLHSVLETKSRAEQLEREVAKFAEWLQSFDLQPPDDDGMETAWCKCLLTRSSILAEEPRVEEFQLKLKEFCRFSQSEEQLCNKVLSVIQDYKRVKGQIVKRCNQLGSRLRCDFQKFLQEFQQWRNSTESLLHLPLDPDGGPLTMTYLQNVEARGPDEVIEFRKMNGRDPSDHKLLLKKFEVWLKTEDRKLTSIFAAKSPRSSRERKNRKQGLKVLQSRVPHGQKIFEELLSTEFSGANEEEKQLEDLRYRWILYKTKLKEAEELSARGPDEVIEFRKETSRGICHYLSRACCAALPLQLLLLLLLLLAFLLPLIEEQDSCSVVNNFARSFYLTLRYQGPPPT
ncbi:nesprin-3 isoform X3 [Stegostoma tigrinum]|uniref:nesprin-3 isoform X3 n=1 Tax=Stegostoma tigrinum TaxID=3053191 RepID=UPI002870A3F2|nr:nesprin-3 isoform X3 [Stegostoma tigrinum]